MIPEEYKHDRLNGVMAQALHACKAMLCYDPSLLYINADWKDAIYENIRVLSLMLVVQNP